ncbi:unannotated protein [freshwater metagenome]|uniref:Unannotated protein n=1 Tax=freshwater metagenome TaxID=449393 RepID=A0A6J6XL91_9ZZZZ
MFNDFNAIVGLNRGDQRARYLSSCGISTSMCDAIAMMTTLTSKRNISGSIPIKIRT